MTMSLESVLHEYASNPYADREAVRRLGGASHPEDHFGYMSQVRGHHEALARQFSADRENIPITNATERQRHDLTDFADKSAAGHLQAAEQMHDAMRWVHFGA